MIIWGSKGREIELGSGHFYCPQCDSEGAYKKMRVARYFTLYFIPLFQIENLGEYIQCQRCQQAYKEEVLSIPQPTQTERVVYSIRADLDSGMPIQMARQKLVNAGVNEEGADAVISVAAGEGRKVCRACELHYVNKHTLCARCGQTLETVSTPTETNIRS